MKLVTVVGGSAGAGPDVPTIGTATGGNAQATVAFTVPAYTGKGGAVVYRAISTPSNIEATASSSPITVTGLVTVLLILFKLEQKHLMELTVHTLLHQIL